MDKLIVFGGIFKNYERHHKTTVRKMCIIIFICFTYNFPKIDRENMNRFKPTNLLRNIFFCLFDTSLGAVTVNASFPII